jgi:hypothetical protein
MAAPLRRWQRPLTVARPPLRPVLGRAHCSTPRRPPQVFLAVKQNDREALAALLPANATFDRAHQQPGRRPYRRPSVPVWSLERRPVRALYHAALEERGRKGALRDRADADPRRQWAPQRSVVAEGLVGGGVLRQRGRVNGPAVIFTGFHTCATKCSATPPTRQVARVPRPRSAARLGARGSRGRAQSAPSRRATATGSRARGSLPA